MAAKVFISYRRDDTRYQADRIRAAFCQVIPRDRVFMDVKSIPPGANFRKILKDWVNQCEVLLALIGPGWIDASDPKTKERRLDNPNDFVRIEIGEALARNIPVVPVLIDGAPLPDIGLLPDVLKELVDRQAEFVEYRTFDADVERLITKLRLDQGVDRTTLQQSMPARRLKAEAKQREPHRRRLRKATHKVLVYVSSGSTCRDPMAKAITEQLLVGRKLKHPVDIYAVGLVPTKTEASYGARQAIKEMYNADLLRDHKPRPFTDELVDKADLILLMDKKLFNATKDRLPQNKTHILKEFFGLSGNVANPWRPWGGRDPKTLERYRSCAGELKQILSTHMDTLLNALGAV